MVKVIRRFVENCGGSRRNKGWRTRRQEFLKPLPNPDRICSIKSTDFITDLPESNESNNITVVTDRLNDRINTDALKNIDAQDVT